MKPELRQSPLSMLYRENWKDWSGEWIKWKLHNKTSIILGNLIWFLPPQTIMKFPPIFSTQMVLPCSQLFAFLVASPSIVQGLQSRELHLCLWYSEKTTWRTSRCGHAVDMPFITHITGECTNGSGSVWERPCSSSSLGATYREECVKEGVVCENPTLLWKHRSLET